MRCIAMDDSPGIMCGESMISMMNASPIFLLLLENDFLCPARMPDVVEHDFNGILVQPASAEAIEEAVMRLAGSVELRKKLGEAARETMKRYTWERSGQMLENLFLRVIAAEKRKTA